MYVLSIQADQDTRAADLLVWVNCNDDTQAVTQATVHLAAQAWRVRDVTSASPTQADDYFPPCKSLDAFRVAETEGVAYRVLA